MGGGAKVCWKCCAYGDVNCGDCGCCPIEVGVPLGGPGWLGEIALL